MGFLGNRSKTGQLDPANPIGAGFWTVAFAPADLGIQIPFEIYHIAIAGPLGSQLLVNIDHSFYDYVPRGDINSWDPAQPMHIQPGRTLNFHWNSSDLNPAIGGPPRVSIYCREPSLI